MTDQLEQRVTDIEDLIADIPQMVSLRMESLQGSQQETSARIGLIDKQLSMVLREMRDLRGGLTRQLVEQDKRLAAMERRLDALEGRLDAVESRLDALEGRLDALVSGLRELKTEINGKLDLILARLPGA
jgi:chromosome segregation ATPase